MATRLGAERVLRPDGSLRPGVVVIDRDRIAAVEEASGPQPDRTIAPGLIDLQVNGLGDLDVAADGAAALGPILQARGTTSWCPTLCSRPLEWYGEWFAAHPDPAPGEIGIHLEGPFLVRPGAHPVSVLRNPDRAWLAQLPVRVRVVTLAPEMPGALEAITDLAGRGVLVSIGHTEASYEVALAAAEAGARMATHVFNGMAPLAHREPGVVGAALADDRLTPGLIADGVHVHPAVIRIVMHATDAVLVSDSVAGPGRLADGTLAGSVVTLLDAVRVAVNAGVPLGSALTAATSRPARLVNRTDRGALQPGARADVLALGPALALDEVWVEGRRVA